MKSVGRWVSRHRIWVILVCAALMVPSVLGMAATRIEYDLLYYLPQDLETVRGQNILLEDFDMGAFSLLVTEGMPEADQASMEETIAEIPHVKSVLGWASVVKGALPAEIIPPEYRDLIQNGDARLTAVFFDTGTSAEETMDAIEEIRRVAGEKCFVSGLSAVVTDTKNLVEEQEFIYVAIAVALCAVVLMITMDSFLLPILFLLCIGAAILWNMGSNYFLGKISYITMAVAAVLQLGVTLDYSIFLWHSYKEEKQLHEDRDEAMGEAVARTFASIVGSSLTTVAGFVSICFMTFTLGMDLGIVMSKGVILGVIGTVVLLPAVLRLCDDLIEKTSHRPLLPNMEGVGRFVANHPKALCAVLVILCVPAFYGYAHVEKYYDMSKVMPTDLPSITANEKLEEKFDISTAHMAMVDSYVSQKDVREMCEEMSRVDGVTGVYSLDGALGAEIPESILPPDLVSVFKGGRYQMMVINSGYVISSDEVNAQIDELNRILKKYDEGGMLIGEAPCTKDLIECTNHDFTVVSLISIIAIFLIIMAVQRSLSLPVILVAVIEAAIACNLCVPYFAHQELVFVGPILISTIQLGATVDYAILLTSRYKRNRLEGQAPKEAVAGAAAVSAQSILVSGLGFFAATWGVGLYSNVAIISTMCRMIARGALFSVAVVILLLPAVILLMDPVIIRTTAGMRGLAKKKDRA